MDQNAIQDLGRVKIRSILDQLDLFIVSKVFGDSYGTPKARIHPQTLRFSRYRNPTTMSFPTQRSVLLLSQKTTRTIVSTRIRCWAREDTTTPPKHQHRRSSTAVLSQTTSFLRNLDNGAEIFLCGTAHVSKKSAHEVREMIRIIQPQTVFVELCQQRAHRLRTGKQTTDADFLRESLNQFFQPGTNIGQNLFKVGMQGFYRALQSLGMEVGGEFKAAMEAADQQGAQIVYGDRSVQETMQRLSAAIKAEDVLRMLLSGTASPLPNFEFDTTEFSSYNSQTFTSQIEAQVESMKTRKIAREMSTWVRELNPALASALIDERDEFMVQKLRKLKGRVVGAVGLAHLDGIERRWEEMQPGGVVPLSNSNVVPYGK